MSLEAALKQRAGDKCELCSSNLELTVYEVPPVNDSNSDRAILLCNSCHEQVIDSDKIEVNHWHCLNDSMWSEHPVVQVMAYRMLYKIRTHSWASDLLEQLYLDDETKKWAEFGQDADDKKQAPTLDSNGATLSAGDSVTIIKDLDVKGANFTAKRGTTVRNISLTDNPEHIEGRVNGQHIVLKTCFLKKL